MKVLLIVGGVLFLLLAFVLFVAAVVVFFMARSRRAKAAAAGQGPQPVAPVAPPMAPSATPTTAPGAQPAPPAPRAVTPMPQPVPTSQPAPAGPFDADGTVVLDARKNQTFGALHGVSGALAGRILPIDQAGFYIGREKTVAQVVIENPSVSKRHVWVGVRDGVVVAIDQQSTNGTYLNDNPTRISEARLSPGDTLIVSDDVARLEYRA